MSDKDKLATLLAGWNVPFTEELVTSGLSRFISLRVEEGYVGFYTQFLFNAEGAFLQMGAYE